MNICFKITSGIYVGMEFGSFGNSMFNFVRNHQTVFHSGCTTYILTSNISISLPKIVIVFFIIIITAIIGGVKWYFIVVLICISLIIINVEHFSCSY